MGVKMAGITVCISANNFRWEVLLSGSVSVCFMRKGILTGISAATALEKQSGGTDKRNPEKNFWW